MQRGAEPGTQPSHSQSKLSPLYNESTSESQCPENVCGVPIQELILGHLLKAALERKFTRRRLFLCLFFLQRQHSQDKNRFVSSRETQGWVTRCPVYKETPSGGDQRLESLIARAAQCGFRMGRSGSLAETSHCKWRRDGPTWRCRYCRENPCKAWKLPQLDNRPVQVERDQHILFFIIEISFFPETKNQQW